MTLETVLFDLDGTLLGLDIESFFARYMKSLEAYVSPHLPEGEFPRRMVRGVGTLFQNAGELNEVAFWSGFCAGKPELREQVGPLFDRYYHEEFPKLQRLTKTFTAAAQVLDALSQRGLRMILATNPLMPGAAVEERLRWAGIAPDRFCHLTTIENSHYIKPDPQYYEEILKITGVSSETAVMVGNDELEDGVATQVGLPFYLVVSEYTIRRGEQAFAATWQGALDTLVEVI